MLTSLIQTNKCVNSGNTFLATHMYFTSTLDELASSWVHSFLSSDSTSAVGMDNLSVILCYPPMIGVACLVFFCH